MELPNAIRPDTRPTVSDPAGKMAILTRLPGGAKITIFRARTRQLQYEHEQC